MPLIECAFYNASGQPVDRWVDPETGTVYLSADGADPIVGGAVWRPSEGAYCVDGFMYTPKAPVRGPATTATINTGQAFKADAGKPRWVLLMRGCAHALASVVRVLTFAVTDVAQGGKGYTPNSWLAVPNAKERYEDALYRHLDKIRQGETHDDESKESHWAHVATNALFLAELYARGGE